MPASHMGNDVKFGHCKLKGMDGFPKKKYFGVFGPKCLGMGRMADL